jgi:sulfur-carrier protein
MAKITLKIPYNFQPFCEMQTELALEAETVGDALAQYIQTYPEMHQHIYTHWGILSANVLYYLNQEDIFALQGLDTPVKDGDRFILVTTATGG